MKNKIKFIMICLALIDLFSCKPKQKSEVIRNFPKTNVIFDTDTNNELDDQHALAYLLLNEEILNTIGVTVNTTRNGGNIDDQYAEAERVIKLCGRWGKIPLFKGADKSFSEIAGEVKNPDFDGSDAVNFIIEKARNYTDGKLTVIAVGKLTNIALALKKDPSVTEKMKLVWLGSNYPDPGEYNQENDTVAMNYLLNSAIEFEIALVRYGTGTGTDAVRVTLEEIRQKMPGKGPKVSEPVTGRHGGDFDCFGDYSLNLFENAGMHGNPPSRALFDMAAVAIVKNPAWAEKKEISCPLLQNGVWVERPDNKRTISIWEKFDRDGIMEDFFKTMDEGD